MKSKMATAIKCFGACDVTQTFERQFATNGLNKKKKLLKILNKILNKKF